MDGAAMSALLWKPTLAATLPPDADLDALPYPLYASPKIDGFRCMGQRGTAVTRKGLTYRNTAVRALFEQSDGEYEGLDGELCVGPPWAADVFNRTQNCVNTGGPAAADEFRRYGALWVIDIVDRGEDIRESDYFSDRHEWLRNKSSMWSKHFKLISQVLIRNAKQLANYEARCLAKGYEGVMLRRGDAGPYLRKPGKENRSTLREFYLVKLKRFEYDEAVITGWRHLEHNLNEEKTAAGRRSTRKDGRVIDAAQVGSATLRNKKFGAFNVTVPTNELRGKGDAWWDAAVGTRIRFKYQLAGTKDKPRILTATFGELL